MAEISSDILLWILGEAWAMSEDTLLSSFTNFLNSSTDSSSSFGMAVSLRFWAAVVLASLGAVTEADAPTPTLVPPRPEKYLTFFN